MTRTERLAVSRVAVNLDPMTATLDTDSPCKLICTLDIMSGVCTGCGRTRADIARWISYSPAQRAFANIEAAKRMRNFSAETQNEDGI